MISRLSLVVVAALIAPACSDTPTSPSGSPPPAASASISAALESDVAGPASAPAPTTAASQFEQKFMTDMIDHHMMAVMMGEMCLERAVHQELYTMCQDIIATQSQEIATMQGWLADWYGVSYEPQMHGNRMHHLSTLDGAEFEIAFMEMMIRHHEGAVREGEMCLRRAYHEELIALCHEIIAAQTAEIAQMDAWLCEWYGRC